MVAVSDRVNKPKTRRGKRALENRAPKVVENDKTALIVKGGKTSEVVSYVLGDIYQLKKPLATQLKRLIMIRCRLLFRKNPFHPLEDETPIERFCSKFDSSLFLFGSNSKKHPNSLVFGRTHDGHLLDMVELNATKYFPAEYFKVPKTTFGSKPMIFLEGPDFETDATKKRLGNLLVDWFRGATVDKVRLQGLETVISFTAQGDNIFMRVYRVLLKKSTSSLPRVELAESGPRVDFRLGRNKLALESLYKAACKQPKQISAKKRKNTSEDVFGTKLARVHVGKQPVESLQTRKTKALKTKAPVAQ